MSSAAGSLAHDMLLAFRDQHLSDITVVAFNQTFHLHRLILLRSGYFRSMILGQGEWIEKSRQAVNIQFGDPYVTLQSFQRIIHWLYGIDYHYPEGAAPINFQGHVKGPGSCTNMGRSAAMARSASASQYKPSSGIPDNGRLGLGLQQGVDQTGSQQHQSTTNADQPLISTTFHRYDNIMRDPSDKVDELLISMYAAASYLNISALMDEICSDIAHRIREGRGLIHYMGYAWKLNNGKAWDIILAQCFYQFFWCTYRSETLQNMLVSPDMPLAGLVKCLVSESLWVPNEFERYQLVKTIMLRRLNLDKEKMMNWIYNYHYSDWFMVLKDLDDNGTWSYELGSDEFLSNLQDWESSSTEQYEDAVDMDHDWASTTRELRRRSSAASSSSFYGIDRNATPTIATAAAESAAAHASAQNNEASSASSSSSSSSLGQSIDGGSGAAAAAVGSSTRVQNLSQDLSNLEGSEEVKEPVNDEGGVKIEKPTPISTFSTGAAAEKKTTPQSPTLESPIISSPSMSVVSISNEALPQHQVRDLLILMYILHHSIHYTHISFEQLHLILMDGLVLPARIKDAFWRQHLLRKIATSTSPTIPFQTAPPAPLQERHQRAEARNRERRTPRTSMVPRPRMSGASTRTSPSGSLSQPCNSHGLLPIRFSTSLYISRRDLMTDGKHFTSSTFYGGSWWSIQVGNNLNSKGIVGVFLSAAPFPRVVPNAKGAGGSVSGGSTLGGTGSRSTAAGGFGGGTTGANSPGATLGGSTGGGSSSGRNPRGNNQSSENMNPGEYGRQRELTCSYRIYMTSNVVEPPEYFAAMAASRLDEIRGSDYNTHDHHNAGGEYLSNFSRIHLGASSTAPTSPEMSYGGIGMGASAGARSLQHRIASEDEMICHDSFKLNEGWGYSKSNYLTRVAKHVRDQPPRSGQNSSSLYSHETGHDAGLPQTARAQAPLQPQQQQPQQNHAPGQQQHGQHAAQNQQPLQLNQQQNEFIHPMGAGIHAHQQQHLQQQQQQQQQQQNLQNQQQHIHQQHQQHQQQPGQQHFQHHQHPGNVTQQNVNQNANNMTQPPNLSSTATTGGGSPYHTLHPSLSDELEDDGLWIHFVVKVGWVDLKPEEETA
ncbi:hypothetical protein BGZ94_006579 [Podila epigama]|nr:hypothetical protein BGZ94_006579 [Podila epigama]